MTLGGWFCPDFGRDARKSQTLVREAYRRRLRLKYPEKAEASWADPELAESAALAQQAIGPDGVATDDAAGSQRRRSALGCAWLTRAFPPVLIDFSHPEQSACIQNAFS